MAMRKTKEINLLPTEAFQTTVQGRIIKWVLTSFRVIVIVTELIVMSAFFSRFYLDTRNADLSDDIRQRSSLITASQDFEREFRETQRHLNFIAKIQDEQLLYTGPILSLVKNIPSDIFLDRIVIGDERREVTGFSFTEHGIMQFIANLNSNEDLGTTSLLSLTSDDANPGLLKFTLDVPHKSDASKTPDSSKDTLN